MSRQGSRCSGGEYQADEQAGVEWLSASPLSTLRKMKLQKNKKNSISFSHQIYEIFVCLLSEKSDSKILKIDNILKIGPKNL